MTRQPTTEQIEAITARGWTWEDGAFRVRGGEGRRGYPIVWLYVRPWADVEWVTGYGVPGIDYSRYNEHKTPMEAAVEAEAWLRDLLSSFRFPWLALGGP